MNRLLGVFRWAFILGAVSFAAGFFGPLAFNPGANQGPLLGIFITGPAGAFLGLVLAGICLALGVSDRSQWKILWSVSALVFIVILSFCFPGPALRGELLEVQIQGCEQPAQRIDAAIDSWNKRVSQVTWAAPRANWQSEARQMSEADNGAVLNVVVVRTNQLREQMKPWNKGRVIASGWRAKDEPKSYYIQFPSACTDYPAGEKSVGFAPYDISGLTSGTRDWPPKRVSDFLDLEIFGPVPDEYRKFIGN